MKEIELNSLKLKTFTEQNALDYCQINNLNSNNIKELSLWNNELTDISEIKIFKNLEELNLCFNKIKDISVLKIFKYLKYLYIGYNQITDISVIKYLFNLKELNIVNLELKSDQIQYINSLNNIEYLHCYNGFKDMNILNELNKNVTIIK